jgi:hypothetical protein
LAILFLVGCFAGAILGAGTQIFWALGLCATMGGGLIFIGNSLHNAIQNWLNESIEE